ncbi:hypothetical protein M4I21_05570 [Cellulophaga sp. 20_2_10]|uniref:hypothetical protein n=1 Tax=Cellulophaga sp. 20_2_10 TaxID=2942476 RepID=UPI00201A5CE6|nr:hypothetical protein [Cellulophaga sp. 20_2_10]MCL5245266.1 hypothetical protein [Cellulophaga sp. 20_2_10]
MIDQINLEGKSKSEILKLFGTPTKGGITDIWTYKFSSKLANENIESTVVIYFDPENGEVVLTESEDVAS